MEKKTQEEISKDFQRAFAKDQFPECGGEAKIEEEKACGLTGWMHDPDCICTECYLG